MKSSRILAAICAASAVALAPHAALAQDDSVEAAAPAAIEPQVRTRDMVGTFGGQRVSYRATIAETVLEADDGKPEAVIVTTSYVKDPRDTSRPVFFLFNGGPGSGSVWLQMGAFGPKRVAIPSDARDDGAPPYPLLDNPDSLLDVADLVFIDPPGTGFSYLTEGTDPKKYYGLEQDAEAVAKVIRLWLNDNGRWNSPKYLGGESYGASGSTYSSSHHSLGANGYSSSSTYGSNGYSSEGYVVGGTTTYGSSQTGYSYGQSHDSNSETGNTYYPSDAVDGQTATSNVGRVRGARHRRRR